MTRDQDTSMVGENQFKCALCGAVHEKARSDEEAYAESEEKFGMEPTEETHAVICDDCYKRMFRQ